MTRKQLLKQLDRFASGEQDANSNKEKTARRGVLRRDDARDRIMAEFDEMRIALDVAHKRNAGR